MRKIYSIMLALFATLCVGTVFAQDAVTFTLHVDHPEAIMVVVDDHIDANWNTIKDTIDLVEGNNTINVPRMSYGYGYVYVTVQEGWGVASIDHNLPESDPDYEYTPTFYGEGNEWTLSVSGQCAGLTYNVVSYDLTAARTDSLLVWIDNNKGATLTYASGNTITLKDSTWNVIRFSPDSALKDIPLQVNPVELVYQVTLNGNVLPLIPGMGWFNPDHYSLAGAVNGDSVEIHVNAPADQTYPVIFNFAEPEMKAALDSVYVDNEKVEYHDTINVAWGKSILLYLNTTTYAISINENNLYRGMYSVTITDTLVLNIEAIAYHDFNVTLKVHNPNCATVKCYINNVYTTLTDLKDGVDTVLTLNSRQSYMMISKNKSCKIDSVMINGKKELNYQQFTCKDNDIIEVFADSVRRTLDLMLYVDDATKYSYPSFKNSGYDNMLPGDGKLHTGYSLIKFDETDNNFYVYMSPTPVFYQNDSLIMLQSWESSVYPTFADGDVFKIFADTAEVYTVGIYVAGDAVVEDATKDRIVAITNLKKNFDVLQGTEVSFKTTAPVLVNGVAAEGVDGVYTLVINENTTIVVGELTSCAEANVATANTVLAMDEFVVAYVNGTYTYIQDATGSALIYKSNYGLNAGDTVTGLVGKISVFKNLVEIVPSMTVDKLNVKAGVAPEPALQEEVITLADVNKYVRFEGVTVNKADTFTTAGKQTINAVWKDTTLVIYNQFKVAQTFSPDSTYDIVCAVSVFNEQLQVYLISATAEVEEEPEPELVSCVVANAAEEGAIVALNEVVVAYVNGSYTYIQDATGSALIYQSNYGLNAGDTVTGLVGKISVFNNLVEIVPSVSVDNLNVKAGVAPEPALQEEVITLADVNKYIRIEGVTVNEADTFTTAGKETISAIWNDTTLVMYNQFKVAQIFSADSIYDIVCAVSVFRTQLQVYLISATAKAKEEPKPEIAQYQLHGSWIENWGGPKLEIAEDQATATATVEMNAGNYGFGIKQIDAAGAQIAWLWTANVEGDTFTREANAFVFVNQKEVGGKNPTLAADVDGVYTFVWTYADNTLTITFPAKPEGIFNTTVDGQAEKFVRDGQLIIRMNGVEYNVLGAKIQ